MKNISTENICEIKAIMEYVQQRCSITNRNLKEEITNQELIEIFKLSKIKNIEILEKF